ncbi:MAG TPA: hypothetical protein VKV36_06080 [Acidimicrobiales bacterium]|nr:hypothetical protein [Acidimicrobiales bacterium]
MALGGQLGGQPCPPAGTVHAVFVSDLRHFVDMPDDAPGPAKRIAHQLASLVRAATAGPASDAWVTAIPCRRRPGRRPCPGHIAVRRDDTDGEIWWRCVSCGDDGVIRGWEETWCDLRRRRPAALPELHPVRVDEQVASTLRDVLILDSDLERLVYRARGTEEGIELLASADELDELVGFVAAEANHEPNRLRQKRLDEAFAALGDALRELDRRGR